MKRLHSCKCLEVKEQNRHQMQKYFDLILGFSFRFTKAQQYIRLFFIKSNVTNFPQCIPKRIQIVFLKWNFLITKKSDRIMSFTNVNYWGGFVAFERRRRRQKKLSTLIFIWFWLFPGKQDKRDNSLIFIE